MSNKTEYQLTYRINDLNKLISAMKKAMEKDLFEPEEVAKFSDSLRVIESKIIKLSEMRDSLRELRKKDLKVKKSEEKRTKRIELNPKVTIKSKTLDIKKEINRLIIIEPNAQHPGAVRKKIRQLRVELDHRKSGYKRPVRILQGGNTGLKK